MKHLRYSTAVLLYVLTIVGTASGQDSNVGETVGAESGSAAPSAAAAAGGAAAAAPVPAYAALLKDAIKHEGMLTLYQKGTNLFAELGGSDYMHEYMVLISIARGIGQGSLLGGYSWSFGDDWIWQFRKIDDRVHVIRKNVRFRADKGYPEDFAVANAYNDSVLFSLRIITKGPKGGDLVDLTPIFMSDLPQIGMELPGFGFAADRSTWGKVKAFPNNVELEVAATYASSGRIDLETVPDSRGVTLDVHYSISRLQNSGYQPRLADDRVGYFLTVVKDYTKKSERDQFVRYINRWNLQRPIGVSQPPFQPKEPIIFHIEKTVPHAYRAAVRAGIEEWNKAFEKAGWLNAIEVRQQLDNEDWDPEDIRYNTFRWITADAGFAMGPSRVNPYTGQILDADIIFDADFLNFWKEEFETLTPGQVAALTGGAIDPEPDAVNSGKPFFGLGFDRCVLNRGMAHQLAFGAAAILANPDPKVAAEQREKLILQGLKEVTMHEVGHTLGLRHNFKASKMLGLKELNDAAKDGKALVGSVMDYSPTNIVPKDWRQGDYYTTTLGPYDYWVMEYGYKPLSGGTQGELEELKKIAARSGDPTLRFATDEDTVGSDPDPDSNRFDLGSDSLEYAKMRAQVVREVMPTIVERTTKEGDDYTQARRAFNILLSQHGQAMFFAARNVGGLHTTRSHKGDAGAETPFKLVDVAKQRDALALLEEQVFNDTPFNFPRELYPYLARSNWSHWGVSTMGTRKDIAIHDVIAMWQSRILAQLLASTTLERMHDTELKAPLDADVLTTAELISRLNKAVFRELDTLEKGDYSNRRPAVSSLRRNLQRLYLREMANLAMGATSAPDDCQNVAYAELAELKAKMDKALAGDLNLDTYTKAHLQESSSRIAKVLDARLTLNSP